MAEITFPEDIETYKGQVRFTLVDNEDQVITGRQVNLFLPTGLQYSDKVEYENADLGGVGAVMAGGAGNTMGGAPSEAMGSEDVRKSIMASIASKLGDTTGQIGRARTKTAPNPNTRALFKQVHLRSFSFQFKLIPTTETEANKITNIVKLFRIELYPDEIPYTVPVTGSIISVGYNFPNRFKIEQFYDNRLNIHAQKIKPAYLDSFTTNYNTTTQAYFQGENGAYFSEVDIAMTFTESKTLSRISIGEGF